PVVIRTRATQASVKVTPRKENVAVPATAGTNWSAIFSPRASKNSSRVLSARSTSVNTAPNPVVTAGVLVPGTKNSTSVTFPPTGVNSRCGEKAANSVVYDGSMLPNRTGTPLARVELTWNPVTPTGWKTAPRGEVVLKKSPGRGFGADLASGVPSQLISRRRPPNDPLAPGTVPPPRSARNWSRAAVTSTSDPAACRTAATDDGVSRSSSASTRTRDRLRFTTAPPWEEGTTTARRTPDAGAAVTTRGTSAGGPGSVPGARASSPRRGGTT